MILLLAMSILGARVAMAQSERNCLSYEPTVVKLRGTLVRKTFPGPDYSYTHRTETYWVLVLRQPICVNSNADLLNLPEKNVRMLQLVVGDTIYKTDRKWLGKRVVATGTLFRAFTIHHDTSVLLQVNTLVGAKRNADPNP